MIELRTAEQKQAVAPFLAPLTTHHLSVAAVLAGTVAGKVWVDTPEQPRVGYAETPEGYYLTGDPHASDLYAALHALIPPYAYLIVEPAAWDAVLDQVWSNPFARPHGRRTYRLHSLRLTGWRTHLPAGYSVVPLDAALAERTELQGHAHLMDHAENWPSRDAFLALNCGVCAIRDDAIVSYALADCVVGDRCELGVATEAAHRRRGLATLVTAAAIERAQAAGIQEIGWQCFASNAGSIAVAEKVGFQPFADYLAYSMVLPAANAGDLSVAECAAWALHCERASETLPWCAFHAAGAWAQAGEPARALLNIEWLIDSQWQGLPEWLETHWMFAELRTTPAFQEKLATLRAQQPHVQV